MMPSDSLSKKNLKKSGKASLLTAGADKSTRSAVGGPMGADVSAAREEKRHDASTAQEDRPETVVKPENSIKTPAPEVREAVKAPETDLATKQLSEHTEVVKTAKNERRGRPSIHPKKVDEKGEKMTGITIELESDLNMFLDFCMEQDKTIKSKRALVKRFIRKALEDETNAKSFEAWKALQQDKRPFKINI